MFREPAPYKNEALLAGLAAGDRKAFESIYRDRQLAIFHFVRRLIPDQAAAEDIATETFVKLWNGRAGFTAWEPMNAFLFKSARNACLDWLRDEKRHAAHAAAIGRLAVEETEAGFEEREVSLLVYRRLFTEIAELPANMQAVLRLYLDGRKNEEIAGELGLAEKTVRNLKSEAIRLLRLRLPHAEFVLLQVLLACWWSGRL
jgi:RNA polymerase sigma-70 factor, ECF subfamily